MGPPQRVPPTYNYYLYKISFKEKAFNKENTLY
ncbi:hypothetical protein [Pseudomonas phage PA1C]|nr:hypothetical protein [Pseudomonas phage PA1C]